MINYRQGKTRYKLDELGSLYVDETKLNPNEQPVIYIGGQMEHRCHILEQTGLTQDPGHNMFTGSWFYDYPVFSKYKEFFNAENFAENLMWSLKAANLHDVILITESYGGNIAAYATASEEVSKVIAIHPSILGTPLANPKYLECYKNMFNKHQRMILQVLKALINPRYGFEKDNYLGVDLTKVDLDKLLVVGNYLDLTTEKNSLLKETYSMIKTITDFRSDGIVTFEPRVFESLGINYLQESKHNNHFEAGTKENIEEAYRRVLK